MRITNETYQLRLDGGATWLERMRSPLSAALGDRTHPLRLSIVDVSAHDVVVEATVVRFEADSAHADALSLIEILHPRTARPHTAGPFGVVQIIPTGTRCEFGGFAGDACPVTNLLAASADVLITHPNAVNASELNEMADNVLYVEGRSLDDFVLGHLGLSQVRANRIGTFIDRSGIGHLDDVVNTVNAARAAGGVDFTARRHRVVERATAHSGGQASGPHPERCEAKAARAPAPAMTARFLRSAFARLAPVARRDERIAMLTRAMTERAADDERSYGRPSFRRYIYAERRLAAHMHGLDRSDRGQEVTSKLKSYSFATSHGVGVPQLFAVWDRPEQIVWDELPDEVVIKSDGGTSARGVVPLRRAAGRWTTVTTANIVESSAVADLLRARAEEGLVRGPFFAEELLGRGVGNVLPDDVKIHAFYGEVSHVLLRRVSVHGDFSANGFRVVFPDGTDAGPVVRGLTHDETIPIPRKLGELCDAAARLSLGIPRAYARVDMYDVNGRMVFGEFTPRPGNPMDYGPELDERFGHFWERAQARVLNDILDGANLGLRFGPGPRDLMIGDRPYVPKGARAAVTTTRSAQPGQR